MYINFLPTFCASHLSFSYSIVNESRFLPKYTVLPFSLSFLLEGAEKRERTVHFEIDPFLSFLSEG